MWTNPVTTSGAGYLMYIGGGLSKTTVIRRYAADGSFTVIASGGGSYSTGILLQTKGDVVEAWGINSGVWTLRCSANDPTFRGPFYIGMAIEDPTNGGLGFTAFGGGVTSSRPQIYRILKPQLQEE